MKLQELLGPVTPAHFMAVYYCKLPYASAGGCFSAKALGTWDVLGEVLAHPDVDLIVARGSERWSGPPPRNSTEGRALVDQGCTVGIRHAHRCHEGLATLAADFRSDFGAPIDVHLYCTPAEQPGFSWHYDAEEVFVLQTAGSKEWSLRKNTVNPWPLVETLPDDMHHEREIMPLMRCTLEAGDWLYIPGGYWHSTRALEESISLSVGINAPAALDILDSLRPHLAQSLLWRQRLPPLGAAGGIDRHELALRFRTLFDELAVDLTRTLHREETISAVIGMLSGVPQDAQ
jgi:50S ribosomal protein L16 3-hydroxylase